MKNAQGFFKSLLFVGSALTVVLQHVAFGASEDILNQALRPQVLQTLEDHPGYRPEQGVPTAGGRLNFAHFVGVIKSAGPRFLVKLEGAYPGAKFAFMGRDTQTLADVTDAFYQSIGQKDRVVQIGVSKPTLVGLSDEQILNYLKSFGLDLDKIDSKSKPFILVDTVSSGELIDGVLISGRQGRSLLQVIYSHWIKTGRDPEILLKKVNMIALQVSTFKVNDASNQQRYRDINDVEGTQKLNAAMLTQPPPDLSKIGFNFVIPLLKDKDFFNESGYDHYTGTWHDKFQPPKVEGTQLTVNPGAPSNVALRKSVLWMQHQIIDIVSDPAFRENVKSLANAEHVPFENLTADQVLVSCRQAYK